MCCEVSLGCAKEWLSITRRTSLPIGIIFTMIAMIFFWTGFSVPDWLELKMSDRYVEKKFGLWLICSIKSRGSILTCSPWAASSDQLPDFLKTTQVLITFGCIFGSFALGFGVASLFLHTGVKIIVQLAASISGFVSALFLTIGAAVFGGDYASYALSLGASSYSRRWGYWLMAPAIAFIVFAAVFYIINVFYRVCGCDQDHDRESESESSVRKKRPTMTPNRPTIQTISPSSTANTNVSNDSRLSSGERSNTNINITNPNTNPASSNNTTPNKNANLQMVRNFDESKSHEMFGRRLTASQQPAVRYGYFDHSDTENSSTSSHSSFNKPNSRYFEHSYRQSGGFAHSSSGSAYRNGYYNQAIMTGGMSQTHLPTIITRAERGFVEIVQRKFSESDQKSSEPKTLLWTRIKNFKYFYER